MGDCQRNNSSNSLKELDMIKSSINDKEERILTEHFKVHRYLRENY